MIFWDGSKIHKTLCQATLIECVYYNYKAGHKHPYAKVGGKYFLNYFAVIFKSSIVIYDKLPYTGVREHKKARVFDKIQIIKDTESIENFPDRFAIETKNIDLLRQLISIGKKVSWLNPDIFTQANYLGILNFEHVFIDPYMDTHIIFPTGEIFQTDEVLNKNRVGSWKIKHMKKIGINLKDIHNRIDWRGANISRIKKGWECSRGGFVGKSKMVNIYNVFSITYMIWRQSKLNVMNARRKIAQKD